MSGTPELTITVPCATYGGRGYLETARGIPCTGCGGYQTVRTPVTCAGCRWWGKVADVDEAYGACTLSVWIPNTSLPNTIHRVSVCEEFEDLASASLFTHGTYGCLSWTAKEATNGS